LANAACNTNGTACVIDCAGKFITYPSGGGSTNNYPGLPPSTDVNSYVNPSTARYIELSNVLSILSPSNPDVLQDVNSAQAKSVNWLANLDPLQVSATDTANLFPRYALATLFFATGGQAWINKAGWLGSANHCSWSGISCLNGLLSVDLNTNNLIGTVPEELFSGLGAIARSLDLGVNSLSGTVPITTLSSMTNLEMFSLYNNTLSGPIPPQIGSLSMMKKIYLDNNGFSGSIPADIGNLAQLERLDLYNNNLSGVFPSTLAQLPSLQRMWVSNNRIGGSLPAEIGNLAGLLQLYLDGNAFSGALPDGIGYLVKLQDLRADRNNFQGNLPSTLGQLFNLEILYLDNNGFTGEILPTLGFLSSLSQLSLSNNAFSGTIPESLGSLKNLQVLSLSRNPSLAGPIPDSICANRIDRGGQLNYLVVDCQVQGCYTSCV